MDTKLEKCTLLPPGIEPGISSLLVILVMLGVSLAYNFYQEICLW